MFFLLLFFSLVIPLRFGFIDYQKELIIPNVLHAILQFFVSENFPHEPNQNAQGAVIYMWLKGLGSGLLILVLYLFIITMFCRLMELKVVNI